MNVIFNKFIIKNENRNVRSSGIFFDAEGELYIQADNETINKLDNINLYYLNHNNISIVFKIIYIRIESNKFNLFIRIISSDSKKLDNIPVNTNIDIIEFVPINIKYQVTKNNKFINTIPDKKDEKNSWDFLEL